MTAFLEQVAETAKRPGQATESSVIAPRGPVRASIRLADGISAPDRRRELLTQLVQGEILPRLALSHRMPATARPAPDSTTAPEATTAVNTAELVRLVMTEDAAGAIAFIELLQLRGASPEALYLGVITDAAGRLGEFWMEDRCSFAQVTISVGRLQQVVRSLSPAFQAAAVSRAQAESILLLPAPGEQHTFGLVMLAEFFRRAGWQVAGGPVSSGYDAADMVRGNWFDVAGFSVGSENLVERLARCIRLVRRASRNRHLLVMVGGPLFLLRPDLVARVGADTAASDGPSAVRQQFGLLEARAAAD
jgi:methanogenic corrinoid protein MtbC1